MKVIDQPCELALGRWSPECGTLICPTILPVEQYAKIFDALKVELTQVCARGFYRACGDFGKIVGPICPFDPVPAFQMDLLRIELEDLKAKVERLGQKG